MSESHVGDTSSTQAPTAAPHVSQREQLELEKLRLEIAELNRSPWLKPSILIPIAATLFTLALSQYLGVFDVERKRSENAAKDAELRRADLNRELAVLDIQTAGLLKEKAELISGKTILVREQAALATKKAGLALQVDQLIAEINIQRAQRTALESELRKLASDRRADVQRVEHLEAQVKSQQRLFDDAVSELSEKQQRVANLQNEIRTLTEQAYSQAQPILVRTVTNQNTDNVTRITLDGYNFGSSSGAVHVTLSDAHNTGEHCLVNDEGQQCYPGRVVTILAASIVTWTAERIVVDISRRRSNSGAVPDRYIVPDTARLPVPDPEIRIERSDGKSSNPMTVSDLRHWLPYKSAG